MLHSTWIGFAMVMYINCWGSVYQVGPGQSYATPNALYLANILTNGDTIEIHASEYLGVSALANWSKNNLVIRGVGGRPHMRANGQYLSGKAIWITSGNNIFITNIEFSECSVPDENGAGIRAEGPDITLRNCYFHHNENGILTNNPFTGHVDIQNCEFAYNGFGDGQSHNVYVGHVNKLTFQYNYSHHANVGHNLKSRANTNIIMYNRIMDEAIGNSSRLIDLPNGGLSIVLGNLLMQGPNAENNNLIGYGLEGLSNPLSEIYVINNTMVNKRTASCLFIGFQSGTTVAQVVNNIFAGIGTLVNGTATLMSNNYVNTNIASLFFVDEPNFDYRLTSISPAVNGGMMMTSVYGYPLSPYQEYVHITSSEARVAYGALDIGAYEYHLPCSTIYSSYIFDGSYDDQWSNATNWDNDCMPPNPYVGNIFIHADCVANDLDYQELLSGTIITIQSGISLSWK